jgi:murein DD-endopeptidase MepM/ murein hydrolase activator NlpD
MRIAAMMAAMALAAGQAHALEWVKQELTQGGFVIGRAAQGSRVSMEGKALKVAPDGLFVAGFDHDAPSTVTFEVCEDLQSCREYPLEVRRRSYNVQNVVGVPNRTVNPSKKDLEAIAADNKAIHAARDRFFPIEAFAEGFMRPVSGTASGFFGSGRTYNGQANHAWHRGYDLAAPVGTPIHAPADGVVTLARHTVLTGNLVMLDHGYGFSTLYAHMKALEVKVGQKVKQGQVIGHIGLTGRTTGPHLHWGLYWDNVVLDPHLLIEHNGDEQEPAAKAPKQGA